jgi:D-cysteine desulfhydrase family pyridoxal phosphate-dependent enzyme
MHQMTSEAETLTKALDSLPRCALGHYPTPMPALEKLGHELGRLLFLKRDDQLGPLLGGNKTRKLEYLIADAVRSGARRIATSGGSQSNHARLTAAAAILNDLEPHLFFMEEPPAEATGNLRLDELIDAEIHYISSGPRSDGACTFGELDVYLQETVTDQLGGHYYIPIGGSNWLGSLGYTRAAVEIDQQAREAGISNPWLIVAAGSGGTMAGLWAGLTLLESEVRLLAVDVGKLWTDFPEHVARLATEISQHLGHSHNFDPEEVPLIEGRYVGERYGVPTAEGQEAMRHLASSEGLLLDPTYTGKAFAGMLDLIASGELGKDAPIIFLHTGGIPGFFGP